MRAPIRAARFLARGQKALVAARCGVTRTRQLVRTCGARVCRLGLKMVETTVIEAPAPSDEKKKSSNLLASAGVNFERRYRSNQTAQNYHVGQSEVRFFPQSLGALFACTNPSLSIARGATLIGSDPLNSRRHLILILLSLEKKNNTHYVMV